MREEEEELQRGLSVRTTMGVPRRLNPRLDVVTGESGATKNRARVLNLEGTGRGSSKGWQARAGCEV